MKITMNTLGVVLIVFGCIWFLQGINVLPGSFMSGQLRWAVNGVIAVAIGVTTILLSVRRQSK